MDIKDHIDAIMHLCFLGHTKMCAHLLADFAICCGKGAALVKAVKGQLDDVAQLQLKMV